MSNGGLQVAGEVKEGLGMSGPGEATHLLADRQTGGWQPAEEVA